VASPTAQPAAAAEAANLEEAARGGGQRGVGGLRGVGGEHGQQVGRFAGPRTRSRASLAENAASVYSYTGTICSNSPWTSTTPRRFDDLDLELGPFRNISPRSHVGG
jgi:hypothetical protein